MWNPKYSAMWQCGHFIWRQTFSKTLLMVHIVCAPAVARLHTKSGYQAKRHVANKHAHLLSKMVFVAIHSCSAVLGFAHCTDYLGYATASSGQCCARGFVSL